ncbi:TatD family hydrolase [Halalkalibacterium ligniniphilum]|uniref:TatD family hydrolase n=1 Tax=Halalkalibacterium ligniniphilum TaxID=1134413 RepID=UPI00034B7DA5|nr:TatD family hydrolase [Halalkalibacterium ligniniphilum]
MFDTHLHLEQYNQESLDKEIKKWQSVGVKGVIAVSNDLASSYSTLELQARYPDFVFAAVGFHPEKPLPTDADFTEWQKLIQYEQKRITAIGEIGLPHYSLENLQHSLEQYYEFLTECIEVARVYDLPVALHAVHDKAELVFNLLQKKGIACAHFHWLKAPRNVVDKITGAGYFISFTPEIVYRKRDQDLASAVPLSQLLIETDGPWQFDARFKNIPTTPVLLKEVLHELSMIKKSSYQELLEQTSENARKCYRLNRLT